MRNVFFWYIVLDPLIPIKHCLNTTTFLSIAADHMHPFFSKKFTHLVHNSEFSVLQWPFHKDLKAVLRSNQRVLPSNSMVSVLFLIKFPESVHQRPNGPRRIAISE